jgi:hypothetical protein
MNWSSLTLLLFSLLGKYEYANWLTGTNSGAIPTLPMPRTSPHVCSLSRGQCSSIATSQQQKSRTPNNERLIPTFGRILTITGANATMTNAPGQAQARRRLRCTCTNSAASAVSAPWNQTMRNRKENNRNWRSQSCDLSAAGFPPRDQGDAIPKWRPRSTPTAATDRKITIKRLSSQSICRRSTGGFARKDCYRRQSKRTVR